MPLSLSDDSNSPLLLFLGCLRILGFSRWPHYPVPSNLGPERRTSPIASQSGDLKRAQAERDVADRAAFAVRQEREGLRRV
ncbi:hypothetical protein LIER_03017 [Lithospermum erythrorhizon]|uniref:Uncharacterized protein n=1 Tax=Lithospermum erythrorhizon TaxID=34254 RepID=A0AAV3NT95_LITER